MQAQIRAIGETCLRHARHRQPRARQILVRSLFNTAQSHPGILPLLSRNIPSTLSGRLRSHLQYRTLGIQAPAAFSRALGQRSFSQSALRLDNSEKASDPSTDEARALRKKTEDKLDDDNGFGRSEKASRAAQINLSAKLSKEGSATPSKSGLSEVWRLLKVARPELRGLALAVAFLLVSSSITMSIPYSLGKILDIATKGTEDGTMLFGLGVQSFYLALGSLLAFGAACNYGRIVILRIVGERTVTRLRSQLFRRTLVQNAEFFDANRVGDLISRLGSDTLIVGKSITQNVSDGLRSLVSACAGFGLMSFVSLKLTGVLALMFPPIAFGAFFYGRAIRSLSRRIQKNLGSLTKIAEERLGSVRTTQSFAAEVQEVNRYNTQVRKVFLLGRKEAFMSAIFFSSSSFMGNMTFLALLYIGGGMVKSGEISVGDLTSFLMYTAYAGSSLFGLSSFYSELMKGVGAASRLFELQDRKPTISPTAGEPVHSAQGDIEFRKVAFAYPTRPAVKIFSEIDFTIRHGTNVAIVAPSGAGKSTVASLILRFYDPQSGQILIDGKDISKMNAKQLRRKIGYVGQEPVLFSGTIAENISYGRPWASRAEMISAARKANCQFISDFPDGLETHVGARGTQLSGGQKQRIAIARALLKNPDILILDEATSALDAESETLVNQAIGSLLAGNNTTISIAHRLSTIKRSDMIICIGPDGRVAETGSYQDLASRPDGVFTKLMEWQMNGSGGETAPRQDHARGGPVLTEEEELAYQAGQQGEEQDEQDEHEDRKGDDGDGGRARENLRRRGLNDGEIVHERVRDPRNAGRGQ